MALPKTKGCMHLEDLVDEKGENSGGVTMVTANGDQVGTEPRDFLGRQQYSWGGDRDGDKFKSFGPDFGMSEEEKAMRYGGMPAIATTNKISRKRRK